MQRKIADKLSKWKEAKNRKPMIIRGARQVGKTWIMKEFGRLNYEKTVYVNFEQSEILKNMFTSDFNIERIIGILQIETGLKIESKNTLLIFDEIQEAPKGITALKYFYENAPQFHVLAAGSLLGVALHENTSFPVGKVDFIDLYPLSFNEFLINLNQENLLTVVKAEDPTLMNTFHDKLVHYLRLYYFIGGMPEVVASYLKDNDFTEIRTIQKRILLGYEQDFSKHAPYSVVPRIRMVWNSLLGQLSKENKKFVYGLIKKGARAQEFELAINWLVNAGLVSKVHRVKKPDFPLNAYNEMDIFKLFVLDVGLLAAMGDLSSKLLIEKNAILSEFKGSLTEQFVFQELRINEAVQINYWSSESARAEIDFVIQVENEIIPIEVKAEENLQSKSLKVFVDKFSSKNAVRTSMSPYRKESWLTNIPLYAIATKVVK
jgi:predicted AAA+ superfamily ATPase